MVAEINGSGGWQHGYVYLGGQNIAIQDVAQSRVLWVHQEPYAKAQRLTNATGTVVSGVEVDPFGGETNRSFDTASVNQRQRYTSYERDGNGGDEAQQRRYERWHSRFYQPDPYDGSADLSNPQSLNRYAYVNNDPVNFTDPSGLTMSGCSAEYSYAQCGGGDGFWGGSGWRGGGGSGFGDGVAEYTNTFGGMPPEVVAAYARYLANLTATQLRNGVRFPEGTGGLNLLAIANGLYYLTGTATRGTSNDGLGGDDTAESYNTCASDAYADRARGYSRNESGFYRNLFFGVLLGVSAGEASAIIGGISAAGGLVNISAKVLVKIIASKVAGAIAAVTTVVAVGNAINEYRVQNNQTTEDFNVQMARCKRDNPNGYRESRRINAESLRRIRNGTLYPMPRPFF